MKISVVRLMTVHQIPTAFCLLHCHLVPIGGVNADDAFKDCGLQKLQLALHREVIISSLHAEHLQRAFGGPSEQIRLVIMDFGFS
jgi:hypothetical protein